MGDYVEFDEEVEYKMTELEFLRACLLQSDPSKIIKDISERVDFIERNDLAGKYSRMPVRKIAFRRAPAILSTICLELIVGIIISRYTNLLTRYPLLMSFQPLLSALSGNMGLQASTTTLRALTTGHASNSSIKQVLKVVRKEFFAAFLIAIVSSLLLFIVGWSWSHTVRFGLVTGLGALINCSLGGIIGSLSPLIFKTLNLDPALMAGPLETALQDTIGTSIYLLLATLFLN